MSKIELLFRAGVHRRGVAIAFVGLAAILSISACGSRTTETKSPDNHASSLKKVRYAVSPFQDTLLPIIGKELGWYKEAGLDVDIVQLGWTEVQEAVASGAVDVGINNISAVVATHERAPNLIYAYGLNTFDNGFALMVRPDGKLRTVAQLEQEFRDHARAVVAAAAQLRGKTVVTTANTDMEQGVAAAARRGNIKFTSIKILNLQPDEGLAAFLSGTGDAYIGGIPQRTRAGKEGMLEMVSGIDLGPAPINGLVTSREYFEKNEDTLAQLVLIWFRTVAFIDSKQGQPGKTGAEIIVRELNKGSGAQFTVDDFWRFWNRFEHYPPNADAAQADILSERGRNYWKFRWDDCNEYFFSVKHAIQHPANPDDAFWMPRLQARIKALTQHTK